MGVNQAMHDQIMKWIEEDQMNEGTDVQRYVDSSMYEAAPMKDIHPKVHLLWMTDDPLGAVAAACRMYEGKPTYSLQEITDEERRHYFAQVQQTHLKAPLEFVKLHFFIEGVDRAFTHQLVRQRTAVYAQESLRFAVKENLAQEVPYPPSFHDGSHSRRNDLADIWDNAVVEVERAYKALIANGIPAEDARGLLPHAVTTRLHFCTDLRNLSDHAGNRLCTQAQFHWRTVFLQIMEKIASYGAIDATDFGNPRRQYVQGEGHWQFEWIADSPLFTPICYQLGHCPFKADFDRGCTIRRRVDAFADEGVASSRWDTQHVKIRGGTHTMIEPIRRDEWLADPKAAWQ